MRNKNRSTAPNGQQASNKMAADIKSTNPTQLNPPTKIDEAYKNIVDPSWKNFASYNAGGAGGSSGETSQSLNKLDSLFNYQGTGYGELPSYKAGSGGGQSLDRLAQMMGGQIYNPYQFARMTSAGSASGGYPYKSALSAQEAAAQAGLKRQEQEFLNKQQLDAFNRQQLEKLQQKAEMNAAQEINAKNMGFSSVNEMQYSAMRSRQEQEREEKKQKEDEEMRNKGYVKIGGRWFMTYK